MDNMIQIPSSEKQHRELFKAVTYIAHRLYSSQRPSCSYHIQALEDELTKAGKREEDLLLLRILKRNIEEGNSKISAAQKKLNNLRLDENGKWLHSALIKGSRINLRKVSEIITRQSDFISSDIEQGYFN